MSTDFSGRSHWQPAGDYRALCTEHGCDWMRVEQFRRAIQRVAREDAGETGHTVELRRQQYKLVEPGVVANAA